MTDYLGKLRLDAAGRAGDRRRQWHRAGDLPGAGRGGRPGRGRRYRSGGRQRVAAEIGRGEAHRLDVTDEAGVAAVVEAIAARHGRIDILVNNAGLGARVPTVELPTERWRQVMAVNLDGSFFCVRAAGRHMLAAGRGAVVNLASIMGLVGGGHYPNLAYHSAKGALVNFTRALACEWAPARHPGQRGRPDLRPHPADRAAARRPGDGRAPARRDAARPLRRARGGRRGDPVPGERCREHDHRRHPAGRWRLDRALTSDVRLGP